MSKAPAEGEQSDPVVRWLQQHGFTANPFAEWEAGKEEWLQRYFVSLPFFDKLYGDSEHPVTTFLFAGRGCGKSAHRVIVQTRSRPSNPHDTVLAIPYTDFTPFLNQSGTTLVQSTLDSHLKLILKRAFEILLDELTRRPSPWFDLLPDEQSEFKRLVLTFASDLLRPADLARRLAIYVDKKISPHDLQNAIRRNDLETLANICSPSDAPGLGFWHSFLTITPGAEEITDGFIAFRRYVHFVRAIGLDAVYVLVDGIDELLPSADPQVWADFLLPLVTALPLMEMPHVAFKFFLPTTVGAALKKHDNARFDRFRTFDLHWDVESLKELLAMRLSSFNKKRIDSLKALAEENAATIENDLIHKAQGSPRAMVLIGHLMFEVHCADVSKPDLLLKMSDLKNAVERFNREYQSLVTAVPLMRVDDKAGRLYIGGRPLDVKLSKREFKVLEFLYRGRGMVRSESEIVEAIGYVSNIAFDSMISRLRAKIESDPENPIYLITERGRGYRLANTE